MENNSLAKSDLGLSANKLGIGNQEIAAITRVQFLKKLRTRKNELATKRRALEAGHAELEEQLKVLANNLAIATTAPLIATQGINIYNSVMGLPDISLQVGDACIQIDPNRRNSKTKVVHFTLEAVTKSKSRNGGDFTQVVHTRHFDLPLNDELLGVQTKLESVESQISEIDSELNKVIESSQRANEIGDMVNAALATKSLTKSSEGQELLDEINKIDIDGFLSGLS